MRTVSKKNLKFLIIITSIGVLAGACASGTKPIRMISAKDNQYLNVSIETYDGDEFTKLLGAPGKNEQRLIDEFLGALPASVSPKFSHNPAMNLIARMQLNSFSEQGGLLANSLTQWMLWKIGVTGTFISCPVIYGKGPKSEVDSYLISQMKKFAEQFVTTDGQVEFGISKMKLGEGRRGLAIAIVHKKVAFTDLKKTHRNGDKLTIRGKMLIDVMNPVLYIDQTPKDITSEAIKIDKDGHFQIELDLSASPGRHFLEMTTDLLNKESSQGQENTDQDKPQWYTRLALVPIYVDAPENQKPDEFIINPAPNPESKDKWPERILQLYNEHRQSHGLQPVKMHPVVREEAQKRAKKFVRNLTEMPESSVPAVFLEQGLNPTQTMMTVGLMEYVDETAWFNLLSPSHRQALLNKDITAYGIGIAGYNPFVFGYYQYFIAF